MLENLVKLFTSLRLTVALLSLGLVLVFWGTLAQVHLGLYRAQNEFFRSFFIFWEPAGSSLKIPIFPGGYLVGGLLLINLLAAHTRYYQPGKRKIGIVMIHLGVVLLLVGQLLTDLLSVESAMHLRLGEMKNYSEADRSYELAITDTTDAKADKVFAIPGRRLAKGGEIAAPDLPFTIKVQTYYANSSLAEKPGPGFTEVKATAGIASGVWWQALPHETAMDRRDMPSGIVELATPQGSLGAFLVSTFMERPQMLTRNGRRYELALRPQRFYKPFSLHLVEFKHDRYPGTDIRRIFPAGSGCKIIKPARTARS
jgi:hypothetical protein